MKKIGLIGGIGPESSIAYYRLIIKRFQERQHTKDYPEIIINSINMTEMLFYVFNNQLDNLVEFLMKRIRELEKTGIDYVAISSNTPHIVFDRLKTKTSLPLISIVEETCREINKLKLHLVGLFGTKSTMTSGFYHKVAERYGIDIILPGSENQDFIHDKYMTELVLNRMVPQTKERLINIVNELKEKDLIEGLILGGTELPLILNQSDFEDIKILDTTKIHVESIVTKMMEN